MIGFDMLEVMYSAVVQ